LPSNVYFWETGRGSVGSMMSVDFNLDAFNYSVAWCDLDLWHPISNQVISCRG